MRRKAILLLALLALGAPSARAAVVSADTAFDRLKTLVGEWEAKLPSGSVLKVSFRLFSGDSTLVETYGVGSNRETLTLFHKDGARVIATHYCGQGNQPRLVLDAASTESRLSFGFLDVTNLATPQSSHLTALRIELGDADHFEMSETYTRDGKDGTQTYSFLRAH
jgi:hypothetical protein